MDDRRCRELLFNDWFEERTRAADSEHAMFWEAAQEGRVDICAFLIDVGVVDEQMEYRRQEQGRTLLYMVLRQAVAKVEGRGLNEPRVAVRWLVGRGADVSALTTDLVLNEPTNTSILALACQVRVSL